MLDSSANGTVSKQGNTTIINTNGLLAYKALQEKSTAIVYNTLTTGRGNQYQLILPDGSRVWLNAASSITYPTAFTGNNRRVTITGEVYFEVKHNSKSPFIVKTGMQEIEDIGTAFNVNAYPDESADITTLVEGKIKVVGYKMQGAGKNEIMLKPGEQARFTSSGIGNVVKDANIEAATAWKNGRFYFNGMELPVIMRQIARWYNVAIAYEGPVPAGHYMGSPSRNLSAAQMLQLLEYGGVKFRIEGRKIIVKQ
jgi:ferric-dicitrate binding protein FerR (iron transport regulator)